MKFRVVVAALSLFVLVAFVSLYSLMEDNVVSDVGGMIQTAVPLPEQLLGVSTNVTPQALWKPRIPHVGAPQGLGLSARSALSYDISSDTLVYGKEIEARLPLASLTKIMTAIVAIENEKLDTVMTVEEEALVGENSVGLLAGEKLPVKELLYGLMLPSGNDAAEVIARNSRYGRENFIYLMNKKAEDLGLSNTRFTNPSGLEGDGEQYSTAYDLLVLTRYALQYPIFKEIVSTYEHTIPASDTNRSYHLFNETNLLTSYPGVKGVKTGYTYEAGMCLVTYLEYEDHNIIAVVLNSSNRRQEMKDLLDYSLRALGTEPPAHL